ncbi:MAG: DUF58 domain-containing protein [Actinomycetota bacterium]
MNPAAIADDRTRELLRRLELDIDRRLDGLLQGDYRGLVSGLGAEPGEAREYEAGDDIRRMDWNVTARMATPHVRDTVADRELETTMIVDLSPSVDFGTAVRRKSELALAVVAAIGILTDRTGNRLGALVTDGAVLTELQARTGRRNLLALLQRLATHQPSGGLGRTGLADALRRVGGPSRRRGLAVVVSDLLDPGWEEPLKAVSRRHETLVVELVDPRELELPNVGVIELRDRETGTIREVDTRSRALRERYAAAGQNRLDEHARRVREAGADHLVLRTSDDWVLELARFVDKRRRRAGRRPRA